MSARGLRGARRGATLLLLASLALALPATRGSAQERTVAIVVNPGTQVDQLSFAQLRQVFLGEEQFWPGGSRITLLVRAPVAFEREVVLNRIYGMSEAQFRRFWIAKIFRAEVASGPRVVFTTDQVRDVVATIRGAISFLPAAAVGPDVKVLRIDGKLPGEPGYPLQ